MSIVRHGAKNAFRNPLRTFSVTVILSLSIGLALVMLLAYKAVDARIENVRSSVGTTILINPAGVRGFDGGGEPLKETDVAAVKALAHVASVDATLAARLSPGTDTSLATAIEAGTLGQRRGTETRMQFSVPFQGGSQPTSFTIPIMATGLSNAKSILSNGTTLTTGELFDGASNDDSAVIGKALAEKNSLSVGSTFTAYGTTLTVKGIFDAGNQFANSSLYFPLKTAQRLSSQTDEVSSMTVAADGLANVPSLVTSIQKALGEDKVDVTSNAESAEESLQPLENIKNISLSSVLGASIAAAVITLLTMVMIVRERRREIGVLKAIGASNAWVVGQFVSESLVLTLMGSFVGVILGYALSNPVLSALVSSASDPLASGPPSGVAPGRLIRFSAGGFEPLNLNFDDLQAIVGGEILLYGLAAAVVIAILGSAFPAWLIARVRPAEVMRSE